MSADCHPPLLVKPLQLGKCAASTNHMHVPSMANQSRCTHAFNDMVSLGLQGTAAWHASCFKSWGGRAPGSRERLGIKNCGDEEGSMQRPCWRAAAGDKGRAGVPVRRYDQAAKEWRGRVLSGGGLVEGRGELQGNERSWGPEADG